MMPWWGWLLVGLVLGSCVVAILAVVLVRRRADAPGHADKLAEAEAEVDRLNTRVAELRLEHAASVEREALPREAAVHAAALDGDTEAQVDVVMDFLGGGKPS